MLDWLQIQIYCKRFFKCQTSKRENRKINLFWKTQKQKRPGLVKHQGRAFSNFNSCIAKSWKAICLFSPQKKTHLIKVSFRLEFYVSVFQINNLEVRKYRKYGDAMSHRQADKVGYFMSIVFMIFFQHDSGLICQGFVTLLYHAKCSSKTW